MMKVLTAMIHCYHLQQAEMLDFPYDTVPLTFISTASWRVINVGY